MVTKTTAPAPATNGLIKNIDKRASKITLSHGPLPNGMPGMTMTFNVQNAAWLDGLKTGQKVRFVLDDAMTIIRLDYVK